MEKVSPLFRPKLGVGDYSPWPPPCPGSDGLAFPRGQHACMTLLNSKLKPTTFTFFQLTFQISKSCKFLKVLHQLCKLVRNICKIWLAGPRVSKYVCFLVYGLFSPVPYRYLVVMSPSRADSSHSSSWRIFSSARLGSWPFWLQLGSENWPKTSQKSAENEPKFNSQLKTYFLLIFIII